MTQTHLFPDNDLWKNKAFAFLVRARQDLWGKHNEEILAWIFKAGFSNQFARDMLLGWNKYPKTRPAANWGLADDVVDPLVQGEKLTLPPGLVIPYMVEKDLRKLMFYDTQCTGPTPCFPLPGGATESMILGGTHARIAVVFNIIHGLLVHQELKDTITVIIPHDPDSPDAHASALIEGAETCLVFPDPRSFQSQSWHGHLNPAHCCTCSTPQEIIQQIRDNP